jgi:hypothetical protein
MKMKMRMSQSSRRVALYYHLKKSAKKYQTELLYQYWVMVCDFSELQFSEEAIETNVVVVVVHQAARVEHFVEYFHTYIGFVPGGESFEESGTVKSVGCL